MQHPNGIPLWYRDTSRRSVYQKRYLVLQSDIKLKLQLKCGANYPPRPHGSDECDVYFMRGLRFQESLNLQAVVMVIKAPKVVQAPSCFIWDVPAKWLLVEVG